MDDFKKRIAEMLEVLGISPRALSIKAGLNPDTVGKILKPEAVSPRADTMAKIAKALGVSVKWLMDGIGEPGEGIEPDDALEPGIRYGGIVEAGAFRPNDNLNQDAELRIIPLTPDRRYPTASQYAFEIVGDSMDRARMYPGMWIQAVDTHAWQRLHGEPRDGMFVVVARTRNGDDERELTVKRLRIYRDRIELCPESSNPRHKPIIFPNPPRDEEPAEAVIIAVVVSSHNLYF
jgi:SOS-response transcriptional repressor LexA